jgi:hypothetical protein
MSYAFTQVERDVINSVAGDVAKLDELYKAGKLSLAAIMAHVAETTAASKLPKDALAIVELADGGHITFKISDKKAISAYGVGGKWPVTLYGAGWLRLLEALGKLDLPKLIEANRDKLAWKAPKAKNDDDSELE